MIPNNILDGPQVAQTLLNLVARLNTAERKRLLNVPDALYESSYKVHIKTRSKYWSIDYGTSGAFLVEKATGELFNIKGYGVPDRNKKLKADIGNIFTVNPEILHTKRYNYLR
jgi:hypothetical protein